MSGARTASAVILLISIHLSSAFPGDAAPQAQNPAPSVLLRVTGEVPRKLELTAEALALKVGRG